MVTGTVVRFDEAKGYGFIAPDGGEDDDVFVHARELADRCLQVRTGTRVQFEIIDGERGLKAYDVRVIEERAVSANAAPNLNGATAKERRAAAGHVDEPSSVDEDSLKVLSQRAFLQRVTDLLLESAPQLTGSQINELRAHLLRFGCQNGWVEPSA